MQDKLIIILITAIFASNGFWSFLIYMRKRKDKKVSSEGKVLRGLAHDRICWLGEKYIARGGITRDEYENLHDYLYEPYVEMGGNGSVQKIMKEVEELPITN